MSYIYTHTTYMSSYVSLQGDSHRVPVATLSFFFFFFSLSLSLSQTNSSFSDPAWLLGGDGTSSMLLTEPSAHQVFSTQFSGAPHISCIYTHTAPHMSYIYTHTPYGAFCSSSIQHTVEHTTKNTCKHTFKNTFKDTLLRTH